jgi:hypothetical protein
MNRRHLLLGGGAAAVVGLGAYAATRGPSYDAAANAVWGRKTPQELSRLHYLVHHATLAANSHNTQPWLFSGGDDRVAIRPDLSRATPVVDPDNHHLYASLGCAAENMSLAASALGRTSSVDFHTGEDEVRIDLGGGGAVPDRLFEAIHDRQCTRSVYDGRVVAPEDLKTLESAARIAGCSLMLVTEKPRMEQVLELILAANAAQIADPAFVAELRHWLRFNAADAVRHGDGLYSACSGNPTMPGWIANLVFGLVFTADAENAKCAAQVRSSAGFAVFVSDRNDPEHWVSAGRSYQRFALAATGLGLRHAFLNQPVEVAHYRPEFAALLGAGDRRPDLVVRFGYADAMPRALRRPVGEVIAGGPA